MLKPDVSATLTKMISKALGYRNHVEVGEEAIFNRLLYLIRNRNDDYANGFSTRERIIICKRLNYLIPLSGFSNEQEYEMYSELIDSMQQQYS